MKLEILFESDAVVAVQKPFGMLVHPSDRAPDRKTCMGFVRNQIGRWVYPVHRLDRQTTGVLLFAKNPESASDLCKQFAEGSVTKKYVCVARGYVDDEGEICKPLSDSEGHAEAPAQTRFRCIARAELPFAVSKHPTSRYSLVEVSPLTGRYHQIRRHLKHLSHPIVGDAVYGDGRHNRFFQNHLALEGLLLWAQSLQFLDPASGEHETVKALKDDRLERVLSVFSVG